MINESGIIFFIMEVGLALIFFSLMKKASQTLQEAHYGLGFGILIMTIFFSLLSHCSLETALSDFSFLYGNNIEICFPKSGFSRLGSGRNAISLIIALLLTELFVVLYLRLKQVFSIFQCKK